MEVENAKIILICKKQIDKCLLLCCAVVIFPVLMLYVAGMPSVSSIGEVDYSILHGKTVVIDAGHGGIDDGAKHNGIKEKDITLAIAQKLQRNLKNQHVNIVMIRESDMDYYVKGKGGKKIDLLKRVAIIDGAGADYFISIHANAILGANWSGAQVFYNPKHQENEVLAHSIQRTLVNFPPGNKRQVKKDSDIIVLKASSIPGVLIEVGFLTNLREAALLKEEAYQEKIVQAIVKGLAYHISQNAGR